VAIAPLPYAFAGGLSRPHILPKRGIVLRLLGWRASRGRFRSKARDTSFFLKENNPSDNRMETSLTQMTRFARQSAQINLVKDLQVVIVL